MNLNINPTTIEVHAPDACPAPADKNISGEHWRFCPQCGHELINEKCKLRCPRCHYFMSCSDFDFAG
jgi:Zn finger protein HypA/HybF involved in hydrogenase expression